MFLWVYWLLYSLKIVLVMLKKGKVGKKNHMMCLYRDTIFNIFLCTDTLILNTDQMG